MTPFRRRKPPQRSEVHAEDILAGHTVQVRAMAERLRALIRETLPDATETAYATWRGIGYRDPECGDFAGIFPQRDHVRLTFEHGAGLDDPDALLEGDGKDVRSVLVRSAKDLRPRALQRLLLSAVLSPVTASPRQDFEPAAKPIDRRDENGSSPARSGTS
jgi:hypothetical protein